MRCTQRMLVPVLKAISTLEKDCVSVFEMRQFNSEVLRGVGIR